MNDITELRKHLFDTLKGLSNKEQPLEIERAKAIADVARVLVDSAKVEVAFLKETGAIQSTNFLPAGAPDTTPPTRRVTNGKDHEHS